MKMPPGNRRVNDESDPEALTLTLATYGIAGGPGAWPERRTGKARTRAAPAVTLSAQVRMPSITLPTPIGSPVPG